MHLPICSSGNLLCSFPWPLVLLLPSPFPTSPSPKPQWPSQIPQPSSPSPYTPSPRTALTPPGAGVPRLGAAEGEAAGLTEGPAEVLVHHGADVPLEVGEEHAAGADVLGLGGSLLLGAAILLLDAGGGVAGEGAAGAGAAAALRGFLHFGVKGEFLEEGGGREGETSRSRRAERRGARGSALPPCSRKRMRGVAKGCKRWQKDAKPRRNPRAQEGKYRGGERQRRCWQRGEANGDGLHTECTAARRRKGKKKKK